MNYDNEILTIKVIENPIIESIELKGIKSQKILDFINEDALIKSRSSYNELTLKKKKPNSKYIKETWLLLCFS